MLTTDRHALDFRLMTNQRVAIMDASHSLFDVTSSGSPATGLSIGDSLGLQPIPRIQEIVTGVVRDVIASGDVVLGKIAAVDVGVVCDATSVRHIGKAIHAKVLMYLPPPGS